MSRVHVAAVKGEVPGQQKLLVLLLLLRTLEAHRPYMTKRSLMVLRFGGAAHHTGTLERAAVNVAPSDLTKFTVLTLLTCSLRATNQSKIKVCVVKTCSVWGSVWQLAQAPRLRGTCTHSVGCLSLPRTRGKTLAFIFGVGERVVVTGGRCWT